MNASSSRCSSIHSWSTWTMRFKIEKAYISWLTSWKEGTSGTILEREEGSMRKRPVSLLYSRVHDCVFGHWAGVHAQQRGYPLRHQAWKPSPWWERICSDYRHGHRMNLESGKLEWDLWHTWVHGSRGHVQAESRCGSGLLCCWSYRIRVHDGMMTLQWQVS